jgi:4-hydroxy-tetrahydrodipicolinate synthase
VEALNVVTNPIPVKAALNMLGHDVGGYRLPLVDPTEEEKATIREALERVGALAAARLVP